VLDKDKTEVRFNSEWLSKITFEEWFRLCSSFTLARILERDEFEKRLKENIPIFFTNCFILLCRRTIPMQLMLM